MIQHNLFKTTCFYLALISLLLVFHPSPLNAGKLIQQQAERFKEIQYTISCAFEDIPYQGTLPLVIKIKNSSQNQHTWTLKVKQSSGYGYRHNDSSLQATNSYALTVPQAMEKSFEITVPITPHNLSDHVEFRVSLSGYGVEPSQSYSSPDHKDHIFKQPFAISKGLREVRRRIIDEKESSSRYNQPYVGTEFIAKELPTDWRAFIGFAGIFITEKEWRQLKIKQRSALKDYIAQGGHLYLTSPHSSKTLLNSLNLPGKSFNGIIKHGFGQIETLEQSSVNKGSFAQKMSRLSSITEPLRVLNQPHRILDDKMEAIKISVLFFGSFIILFGVIVGPFNVYFLCRKVRTRLLWTTPLISIAFSLLLILLIIFKEGFGGYGHQTHLSLVLPQSKQIFQFQIQASRSGALFKTSFELPENSFIRPVRMNRNNGSRLGSYFNNEDLNFSGEWFNSRNIQGQFITHLNNGRNRLEIKKEADGSQSIHSSFAHSLQNIYIRDDQGQLWFVENLEQGKSTPLTKKAKESHFNTFIKVHKKKIMFLGPLLENVKQTPGWFFATSQHHPHPIPTLESIEFETDLHVLTGALYQP